MARNSLQRKRRFDLEAQSLGNVDIELRWGVKAPRQCTVFFFFPWQRMRLHDPIY